MKTMFSLMPDCNPHVACHTLAKVIDSRFPGSKSQCLHDDVYARFCRHEGLVLWNGTGYHFILSQSNNNPGHLDMIVESQKTDAHSLIEQIVSLYSERFDTGGNRHQIKIVPNQDKQ